MHGSGVDAPTPQRYRHWLIEVVFCSTVGIIAGRTVTSHEAERPFPIAATAVPGGMAIMYVRQDR